MKSIELTQTQIKAYENGSTIFLFPIDTKLKMSEIGLIKDLIQFSPVQKCDKNIFVQEEFTTDSDEEYGINDELVYYSDTEDYWFGTHEDNPQKYRNQWLPASKMTKDQSRYSFSECIDAKAIRVKNITIE